MILRIAFRNTLRQKRRTALTLLTIFGGFTLAAIAYGWSDGTYSYIINVFTRNRLGHIQIHSEDYLDRPSLYKRIQNYRQIGDQIQEIEGVEAWAPRVLSAGLASLNDKTVAVQLIGMDVEREETTTGFSKNVVQGVPLSNQSPGEVLVGKELARILKAGIGEEIVIVTQGADGSLANDIFRLSGIVDTGDDALNRVGFYMTLPDAQELLVTGDEAHEIVVIIHNLKQIDRVTQAVRDSLDDPTLDIQPWQVFAKSFYDAMKADQDGMWIMLAIIIFIVAIGVLNTVLMSVLERRREYGLLKAVGTRPAQIVKLVLAELSIIAIGGIILGTALSIVLNWLLSIYGITLPVSMSYGGENFTHMYSEVNARSLYLPAITVFLSAVLVGIAPAVKAARTEPAQSMRTF